MSLPLLKSTICAPRSDSAGILTLRSLRVLFAFIACFLAFHGFAEARPQSPAVKEVARLYNAAEDLCKNGDFKQALPLYERCVLLCENSFGPLDINTAKALNYLACNYRDLGDYSKALALHERALEIRKKNLGLQHPDTAVSFNNLAMVYSDTGEYTRALSLYEIALGIFKKSLGPHHPETATSLNNIAVMYRAMGNYEKAIPWLQKYVNALPFKTREHTDNFYRYCLVVALEEHAKHISPIYKHKALELIQEASKQIQKYDENAQIANRLSNVKEQIESGKVEEPQYVAIEELPPLETETQFKGVWSKWQFSDELKGFHTNNWMVAENGVWFFNGEKNHLVFWDKEKDSLSTFQPTNWPEGCGRLVYDQKNRLFYAWSSIRSTVFELTSPEGNWNRLSYGVHDVHACGASFAFDSVNNRLFEFGGYGYFTYKNWLWVYDIDERKWIQLKENRPGISPYPRNGQLLPIENGNKALLISGIGSDTGIQREHKARLGLASATDVGYFTWLRDAHELDLAKMEWKTVLHSNHESIRHEGAFGFIHKLNLVLNWAGIVPSPTFGVEAEKQSSMSCWQLENESGFNFINYEGIIPPMTEGSFLSVNYANNIFYIHDEGIWKLSIYDL